MLREKYFWKIHGKVFCPYRENDVHYGLLILGLENPAREEESLVGLKSTHLVSYNQKLSKENTDLLLALEEDFTIKEYQLGTEPYVYYERTINGAETSRTLSYLNDVESNLSEYKTESVLFGCYRSPKHLEWISRTLQYNVRFTEHLQGTVYGHSQPIFTAMYLFLYDYYNKSAPAKCYVLDSKHTLKTGAQLIAEGCDLGEEASSDDLYFIYKLREINGSMTVDNILSQYPKAENGAPLYLHFVETQSFSHEWFPYCPNEG